MVREAIGRKQVGSPWFERRSVGSSTRGRLICFPHAGGSGGMYVECFAALSEVTDLVGVELPGRGTRFSEGAFESMGQLVAALAQELEGLERTPCMFFGHSFGGALAYALAARLQAEGRAFPLVGLIISSCRPPHLLPRRERPLWSLPRREFFSELHDLNGLPPDILSNTKLQDWIEPALRADIRARDLWAKAFEAPAKRLAVPIFPLGGALDPSVPGKDLDGWRSYTDHAERAWLFDGGHFYFRNDPGPVVARIRSITEGVASR